MRISDWSSDVCSSDLEIDFDAAAPLRVAEVGDEPEHRNARIVDEDVEPPPILFRMADHFCPARLVRDVLGEKLRIPADVAGDWRAFGRDVENGRARCRERGGR